ncbi:MAG: hypothetical protein ABI471_01610 [Sphingomonas bacterium]
MHLKSFSLATTLAMALLVSGCESGSGKAYDQPLGMVHDALVKVEEPPMVFGDAQVDFVVEENRPDRIVWTVGRGGVSRLRLEATLSADSATSTRVRVKADLVDNKPAPAQGAALQSVGSVLALYKAAMEERIDSTLMHRDFNITALSPAILAAEAANIGTIRKQMHAAGEAFRKRDEDNIRKAYADEAAGRIH